MSDELLITDCDRLRVVCDAAREAGCVALDTEFVWTRTYYAILGLVQVGWSKEHNYLIDTVAIKDLEPLGELLADASVEKVLHDAQQDLMILRRATGASPVNVFDTRLACGFCGWSAAWGLGRLMEEALSITLDKSETRTDWTQRPLTAKQIEYAVDDIKFLPEVREVLLERVAEAGNTAWLAEEMLKYDDPSLYEDKDPYEQYSRVKGGGGLKDPQMALLRNLAAWREQSAIERNIPRGRVAKDDLLVDVARALPQTESALRRIKTDSRHLLERSFADIWAVVKDSQGETFRPERGPRMDAAARKNVDQQVKRLSAELQQICEGLKIDPIMVAPRADLKAFVEAAGREEALSNTRLMQGWRKEAVGNDLNIFVNA